MPEALQDNPKPHTRCEGRYFRCPDWSWNNTEDSATLWVNDSANEEAWFSVTVNRALLEQLLSKMDDVAALKAFIEQNARPTGTSAEK